MPEGIDIPSWLAWVIVGGAAVGALRAVGRTRLVRWLTDSVSQTITDAVRAVVREEIAPIRAELRPNGGTSLRDQTDRIEQRLDEHIEHSAADRAYLHDRLDSTIDVNELAEPDDET